MSLTKLPSLPFQFGAGAVAKGWQLYFAPLSISLSTSTPPPPGGKIWIKSFVFISTISHTRARTRPSVGGKCLLVENHF